MPTQHIRRIARIIRAALDVPRTRPTIEVIPLEALGRHADLGAAGYSS